jgi:hypothetical protein
MTFRPTTIKPALLATFAAATLTACAPELPNAYSPGYSRVSLDQGGEAGGRVRKGYDGDTAARRTALVPDACVTPDVAPDPLYLPSGCANAANLQMMVENERDLERGQTPGRAMAAPVARAARGYIDGTTEAERRRRIDAEDANTRGGGAGYESGRSAAP